MAKNLVIVESPSKSKTIEKYLGKDFKVVSSKGHIRDLSKSGKFGLGVDLEDNFKPKYTTIKGKKKDVDALIKDVKNSDFVYLATDPDREGEAISWHLYDALKLNESNYERVVFNEITKDAVINAFDHTRKIDQDLVNSQETRRILDRIIGFRLSKLMQAKTSGSSAGRVQSVALKLIVEKEREIEAFNSEEYWTITSVFESFEADLFKYNNKDIEISNEIKANEIYNSLSNVYKIENVESKSKNKKSKFPFTTSTLQQEASSKLGFSARKTMQVAQKLYEGIELSNETVGLITYMRTDSIRLSEVFVGETLKYIKTNYGKEYIGYVKSAKKKENVQDAHEAIRPTSILKEPLSIKQFLSDDEYRLYKLIYFRTLASLMSDAKTNNTQVILDNNNYKFKATGQIITFDGYLKAYKEYEDTKEFVLPDFKNYNTNVITTDEVIKKQHFTQPPARYTEAKLIKELEELGIGRPSTYASIVDVIKKRGYVLLLDKKFNPTDIGIEITDKLQVYFNHIINVEYTANMENDLDKISVGDAVWYEILKAFYDEFEPAVEKAFGEMEKKPLIETGELCPNCNSPLVIRKGRYGEFEACSNFPECKYIKQEKREEKEIIDCPNCEGKIVEKQSRKGKIFYGCNNYPKCKTAYWDIPTENKCETCNGVMLKNKKDELYCPECKNK
ncbi:MAG: type I DNA topoisomerase [Mycoplasmatota bacterium]